MPKEEWRPVPDFPNYQVSNWGRVYNTKLHHQMSIKNNEVNLMCGLKRSEKTVGRLVWNAFKGQTSRYAYIIHLNGDPNDNHLSNLALQSSPYIPKYEALGIDSNIKRHPEKHYRQHIREFLHYVESKYGHDWHTKISDVDDPKVKRWYRFIYECR